MSTVMSTQYIFFSPKTIKNVRLTSSTACDFFPQHMATVWLLPSLIMVNVWMGDSVKDLSICHSVSCSGSGDPGSCPDRLCLITENSCAQVAL